MDYIIKNHKNVYIRLNSNGKPVTCTEHQKTLFEESKAKNIIDNLPNTLKKLKFKIEAVPDIINLSDVHSENNVTRVLQTENYIVSDQIKKWIEKFGICDDILKEAKKRKDELNIIISNYDRAISNWLHEVEIEKKKNACRGYLKYIDVKEIVDKRRVAKDEWIIINNILQMDFRNLDKEVVSKAVAGLAKRKFTYRMVEEEVANVMYKMYDSYETGNYI